MMAAGEEVILAKTSADASEETAAPPAEEEWRHLPPPSPEVVVHVPSHRPQRFRKPNYTEAEKRLIYSLLLPRLRVVENKSLDRRVLKEKHLVWKEVTSHYNAAILASGNSLVVRDVDELRTFWKNARRKAQWREQIQSVPDLMERLASGSTGSDKCKQEAAGDTEDDNRGDETNFIEPESVLESTLVQDQSVSKSKVFQQGANTSQADADDPLSQDDQQRTSPTAGTSGLVGPYLLKKEAHCSTVLDQLMRDETFTDVTLTAEGQSLRAHRIVLCLASPYFRQVLSRELTVQSVVVLRDIKFSELRNIIHFIYTGEATVDASELESFMRTAEMLEIASLCEGQKSSSNRGPLSHNSYSSGFTIGDFERLVGTKRTKKEASPTPSKARRLSGEGHSSRSSSTEPTATINPLSLIKEEPDCDNLFNDKPVKGINENADTLIEETQESERIRRDSGESVGGFAAIAGVQKSSSIDERAEDFSSIADSSPVPPADDSAGQNLAPNLPDTTAVPGRCPYCPHLMQKFEGVAMMRHLLVSHPCKPAFPCDSCWRVFVKRTYFKSHQQKCQQPLC